MKREKVSIKWKIFGYLLGFAGLLLVILWMFQTVYLEVFYKQIKRGELANAMDDLESGMGMANIEELISTIAKSYDITVIITQVDGTLLYTSDKMIGEMNQKWNSLQVEEWYHLAREQDGNLELEETFSPKKQFMNWKNTEEAKQPMRPLDGFLMAQAEQMEGLPKRYDQERVTKIRLKTMDDGTEWMFILSSTITPVDATVHTLRIQLMYISGIMVLLSLLIAWGISKKVSRSIIRVNQSAKELAKANYQVIFDAKDYKEIAELSETLNYATMELAKTEHFQRELLANVSHDLRTPLTMIIAYAEVMRDLPGEQTPENVQIVIDEAERLTALVNDMLNISKLQAGVVTLNYTRYDLTESICSVIGRFSKLTQQDGYQIKFDYTEHLYVEADEYKINQVIYNLINNAIHYAGEEKRIMLIQRKRKNVVRIEVKDDGEGIAQEVLPYVWERYYKVDKTHRRAVSGSGLGLSIVKNIVKLHGGTYGVCSQIGKGSTFWFELNAAEKF